MELDYTIINYTNWFTDNNDEKIYSGVLDNNTNTIVCNYFYIPYFYNQGAFNDLQFTIELYYKKNIRVFKIDLEFELFKDSYYKCINTKTHKWLPSNSCVGYNEEELGIIDTINTIEIKECFILNKQLVIKFNIEYTE